MKCTEIQRLIPDYSVGLGSTRARAEIEEHLAACQACRTELHKLESVALILDNLQPMEPPAGLWNGVYNRIAEPETAWDRMRMLLHPRARGLSVGFATAVLVIVLLLGHVNHPGTEQGYAANEYIQGHATYASQEILADQAALNSVAAMAHREHLEGMGK